MTPDQDGPRERDAATALERTRLAWSRTAISVAALGGVALKVNVPTGLTILAIASLVWQVGRLTPSGSSGLASPGLASPAARVARIRMITLAIVAVSVLCLIVALLGPGLPGELR